LEKVGKYQELKREIRDVGCEKHGHGTCCCRGPWKCYEETWTMDKKLGIRVRIGLLQKITLLGTARMLRRLLDFKVPGECPQETPGYDLLPWDVC